MAASRRQRVLVAVAVALLTVPIWAPVLDLTGRDYQYRATEVSVEDNRVQVPDVPLALTGLGDINCMYAVERSRLCAFDARLRDGEAIQAPDPGIVSSGEHVRLDVPSDTSPSPATVASSSGRPGGTRPPAPTFSVSNV